MGSPQAINNLEEIIGSRGLVEGCYGGIRIVVLDPAAFPWWSVLERLTESFDEVWLRRQEEKLEIISKSKNP